MTGNLLGEEFDQYVFNQIDARQKLSATGFGSKLASPSQINLLNNKTSFIKLASGVNFYTPSSPPTFDEALRSDVLGKNAVFDWRQSHRLKDDSEEIKGGYIKLDEGEKNYEKYLEQLKQNDLNQIAAGKAKLKELGFSESEIKSYGKGSKLAQQCILFNGMSSLNKDDFSNTLTQRSGINLSNSVWTNKAYGLGGGQFGKQPMPGITSATVDCINRGSIRSATVQIKAFNTFQFQLIELLYLRLGFTMMLEWGHNIYTDGNSNEISKVENTLIEDTFFSKGNNFSQLEILEFIEKTRQRYSGNYDGFFGRVSNFSWSFAPDGTYDITLKLITLGDIIESLQINVPAPIANFDPSSPNRSVNAPNTISVWLDNEIKGDFQNRAVWGNGRYINLKSINSSTKIGSTIKAKSQAQELGKKAAQQNGLSPQQQEGGNTGSNDFNGNVGLKGVSKYEGLTKEDSYYVTFGGLLEKIYNNVIPRVSNGSASPLLEINLSETLNVISAQPNQISFDLNVCFIKPKFYAPGVTVPDGLTPEWMKDFFVLDKEGNSDVFYGQIMNIYLNFNFIKAQLEKNTAKDGVLSLYKFLEGICSGLNNALGNVNKIEPIINSETNELLFIDQNPIRGNSTVLNKLLSRAPIPTNIIPFEIYGFNTETGQPLSNFVKNFKFDTKIDSKLSSMITIGTTAGGSTSKVTDGTAFSNWNSGLQDRFQQKILPPSAFLSPIVAEELAQKEDDNQIASELTEWWGETKSANARDISFKNEKYLAIKGEVNNTNGSDFLRHAWARRDGKKLNVNGKGLSDYTGRKTGRYKGYNFEYKDLDEFISGYLKWKKDEGKDIIAEGDIDLSSSYQSWLCYAFGGQIVGKKRTDGSNFFVPSDEGLYLNPSNKNFYKHGKQSFKEYIRLRDQKIYRLTGSPSSQQGFIPVELGLTIDGLSGVKIYQKINIKQKFLPSEYKTSSKTKTLDFIITKVNHKLNDNKWETILSTISIPPTEPQNTELIDKGIFSYLILDESGTVSTDRTINGTAQRFPVSQLSPDSFIREELKKSEGYYSGKENKVIRSNGIAYAYPDPKTSEKIAEIKAQSNYYNGKESEPWTIGYGQTFYTPGQEFTRNGKLQTNTGSFGSKSSMVREGDSITKQSAELGFETVLLNFGKQMVSNNKIRVPLTQNEYNALLSFSYNSGPGVSNPKKPLYNLINSQDYVGAGNKLQTTLLNGGLLTSRRNKEADIWFKDNPGNP